MAVQGAETARQALVALGVQGLAAKGQHQVLAQRAPDVGLLLGAQVLREIDAAHLGADRRRQRAQIQAAEGLARPGVPGFDRLLVVEVLIEAHAPSRFKKPPAPMPNGRDRRR
jgi:hypothetical protein